jgi:hypothetical protein
MRGKSVWARMFPGPINSRNTAKEACEKEELFLGNRHCVEIDNMGSVECLHLNHLFGLPSTNSEIMRDYPGAWL